MSIMMIASHSARPARRLSPADPSSAVTSRTSWSFARAQAAMVSMNGNRPAVPALGWNGTTRPTTWVRRPARARAPALGSYVSSSMAASTRWRVRSEMGRLPVITYDTVLWETPAMRATSLLVKAGMGTSHRPSMRIVDTHQSGPGRLRQELPYAQDIDPKRSRHARRLHGDAE